MSEQRQKFNKGVRLKGSDDTTTIDGEIRNDKTNKRIKAYHDADGVDAAGEYELVSTDQTQTLTNKTQTDPVLDGDVTGTVIDTDGTLAANSDTKIASQQAVKEYVDAQISSKDEASEISYDNSSSGLAATDVQAAIDETEARLDTAETGLSDHLADAVDAHDASAISNIPSGNLAATDIQGAVDELQTDIDTRALDSNLTSHTGASVGVHGVTGSVVGTSDSQTLTNKLLDGTNIHTGIIQHEEEDVDGGTAVPADITAAKELIRLIGTPTELRSIIAVASGRIVIINKTGSQIPVKNEDVGATAANRIITGSEEDINLAIDASLILQYNDTDSRWHIVGGTAGSINADDVVYDNTTSGLTATDAQAAIDEVEGRLDTAETNIGNNATSISDHLADAVDAHDASAISYDNTSSGLTSIEVQAAIDETEARVDTNETDIASNDAEIRDLQKNAIKNYIGNPDAEVDTSGYTVYANTVAGDLPDDFGGVISGNLTFSRNTTDPLSGDADFKLSTTAANLQGEGVYYEFTLDKVDLVSILSLLVRKDSSDSGIADGDYRYVLVSSSDNFVADFNVIRSSGAGEDLHGSTNNNSVSFQTDALDLTYRLCFHRATTDATATDLYLDELSFGPNNSSGGSSGEIVAEGKGNAGTTLTANVTDIDFIVTRDTTSSFNGTQFTAPESGDYFFSGSNQYTGNVDNSIYVYVNGIQKHIAGYDGTASTVQTFNGSIYLSKDDILSFRSDTSITLVNDNIRHYLHITKVGTSDEANATSGSGRDIVASGRGNSGAGISASTERIDFTTTKDTTSSWSSVSGNGPDTFTAPESGEYLVVGQVKFTSSINPNIYAYIDNTLELSISGNTGNAAIRPITGKFNLEKGQTLDIRPTVTATLQNNTNDHWISIQKVSTASSSQDSVPFVGARYTSDSGQTVSNAANYIYEDLDYDTHNAYNSGTGVYTTKVSGYYLVQASARPSGTASLTLDVEVNGVSKLQEVNGNSDTSSADAVTVIYLRKDDEVEIVNRVGSARTLSSVTESNVFTITRMK